VIQANGVISKAMRTAFRTAQISGFLLDAGITKTRAYRQLQKRSLPNQGKANACRPLEKIQRSPRHTMDCLVQKCLDRVAEAVLDCAIKLLKYALTPLINWVILGQQLHFANGP